MTTLGINLGERQVVAVVVDDRGAVVWRGGRASASDAARAVRDTYGDARQGRDLDGIGITIPFDGDHVPASILTAVSEDGHRPVTLQNGHASVLAEAWCGAAAGCSSVVALSIGEHVTAGVMLAGTVLTGAHGHAASVAWLALNPVEREDYRRRGGLEAEVSAAGIVRRLVWRIKSGDRSGVVDRVNGDLARLTASDVFTAARAGDGVCESVVRDTAKYVGMAVANIATIVDPECVVLGGTLASAADLMLDVIRTECARRVRPAQRDQMRLVLSTLGDDAGAIGAARAAQIERR